MKLDHAHLPNWLTSSWLFRKLFLLRKVYFTRRRFGHYGQFAEDVAVRRLFPRHFKGFYVDVGCYHPAKFNNTYALYRRGWRGINIDLDAIKIEAFDMARPGDVNVARAISDEAGEVRAWSSGFFALGSTLDESFTREQDARWRPVTVRCDTLTHVIDATRYKDRRIDFLSVDAEGHDLQVLESLDFERYRPTVVAVELHRATLSEVTGDPLYRFLNERGYELVNWTGLTLLFKDIRNGDSPQ